jgi:Fe-S cluster assembly protein SufD
MSEIQTAEKHLSVGVVETLSRLRGEPEWLLKWRLEAWRAFENLPLPGSRYTQIRGLDLDSISPVSDSEGAIPKEFQALVEQSAEAAGLFVQVDGGVVRAELPQTLKEKGVLFLDIATAIKEHPDLIRQYLEKLESPKDKITALQHAIFCGGIFLYVPKGIEIEQPLKAVQFVTRPGAGVFTQSFIIAEPQSALTYIEELYSPEGDFEHPPLQANTTLVHLGRGARVDFAGVQDWHPQIFSFIRRRGVLERDAQLKWTLGWLGGRLTMSHVESVLDGPGAQVEDVQVFFTDGRQHFDLTSNLLHQKPHTKGEVTVKGILKGKSKAVFWGLIRIEPGAQGSNAFQSERSLILEDGPRSNAIPSLEIEADDVRCTHAASASQIDEEQVFYLMSRGLSEDEAKKAIVDGFFEPTVEKIPLEPVKERLRALIDRKWREGV